MNTYVKKMFSLNLAAYVLYSTDIIPEIKRDETTNTCYCIFPECEGVQIAIRQYRDNKATVQLKEFLEALKEIRQMMHLI